jgi:hypothetical protein
MLEHTLGSIAFEGLVTLRLRGPKGKLSSEPFQRCRSQSGLVVFLQSAGVLSESAAGLGSSARSIVAVVTVPPFIGQGRLCREGTSVEASSGGVAALEWLPAQVGELEPLLGGSRGACPRSTWGNRGRRTDCRSQWRSGWRAV